ncbi:DUF4190 domain-containing protein [Paenibacillus durus]|uniref:DUF4190 domain-containing protein n=1 Tax=Paenibacillus durus TaxID=44251 RepID=A0A089HSA4_PAEDU|nr:DUF4190 domain-containing protein [Paenibacillus durus]AIQ13937.1 hypothetical protein PDUR_20000 [Paenibacillus durus]
MDSGHKGSGSNGSKRKKIKLRPRRVDYPRKAPEHREEYASEISPFPVRSNSPEDSEERGRDREGEADKTAGYAGLVLGIASLFIWPIILGPSAAVLGYYAYNKGRKTAGGWAIGLGIVATLSYFVMIPFAR